MPAGYFYTQVMGFTTLQVRYSECWAGIKDFGEKAERKREREGWTGYSVSLPAVPLARPVCFSLQLKW